MEEKARNKIDQIVLDAKSVEDFFNRLLKEYERLEKALEEKNEILQNHPRAAKLMKKNKFFIVIAMDEPYFSRCYSMIRLEEKRTGRWDDRDEEKFFVACDYSRALLSGKGGNDGNDEN